VFHFERWRNHLTSRRRERLSPAALSWMMLDHADRVLWLTRSFTDFCQTAENSPAKHRYKGCESGRGASAEDPKTPAALVGGARKPQDSSAPTWTRSGAIMVASHADGRSGSSRTARRSFRLTSKARCSLIAHALNASGVCSVEAARMGKELRKICGSSVFKMAKGAGEAAAAGMKFMAHSTPRSDGELPRSEIRANIPLLCDCSHRQIVARRQLLLCPFSPAKIPVAPLQSEFF
jgi:hypothetical protein